MRMTLARDNIEGIRTAEDDTSFVGAPFKLTFGNVARETLRLAKVERLPFVHTSSPRALRSKRGSQICAWFSVEFRIFALGLGFPAFQLSSCAPTMICLK